MSGKKIQSVAVVGAGMAGISCAVALKQSAGEVRVFEKAPAAGGRMCSFISGDYQHDGGAQYFTVRSDAFKDQVQLWRENWLADEWQAWIVDLSAGEALSREDGVVRFVGRPTMQSCIEDMADLCEVQYGVEVGAVRRKRKRWQLFDRNGGELGLFDAVVVAVPAPQAVPLLEAAPVLAERAAAVDMTPCWSVMLAFEQSLMLGFDAAFLVTSKLSWAARDSGKPERPPGEVWVLHASPEWSAAHPGLEHADVVMQLMADFEAVTRRKMPMPACVDARYWPAAKVVNPLDEGFLFDPKLKLGLCGDWCRMARVEGAYLSGVSLATEMLKHIDT